MSGRAFLDSDVVHAFRQSPAAIASAFVALVLILSGVLAPWLAPHDPTDLATLSLLDSFKPPWPAAKAEWVNLFGTDSQGRDMLSAIMYGMRVSLLVGFCSVAIAVTLGILIGLTAGYLGGAPDTILMRIADVQLTFPAILTALMINGIAGAALPRTMRDSMQVPVIILSIGISLWPGIARTVRGSTLVERDKEYVLAARVIGATSWRIMLRHVLPNVLGPVLVLATLGLGLAVLTEATLSFLGVGLPPTRPSLGTLIRYGNDFLFSGQWWVTIFPGITLVLMVLSINLLGDWLRDALNPRLR
ncbi:MAG: ABC transporter permease [Acetobacteraceae bacterium]|nr:ABC transporter permease [Acetobacteraceae bacterium]